MIQACPAAGLKIGGFDSAVDLLHVGNEVEDLVGVSDLVVIP